ncbi:MAG: Chaperone of endosialidase [Candidatus Udaeobacter sp.]|nr:MAG: Chaperone of endosialidase [Candidatus Udaeobacter sp.]
MLSCQNRKLFTNTTGAQNTATGAAALLSNTSGVGNSANGFQALSNNTTGAFNTAKGALALLSNTTGDVNVAAGQQALFNNTTGDDNVALGASALFNNTTGTDNVGIGFVALQNNTGSGNVALGSLAGAALTSGNSNICIGNNVIGVAGESNTLRIGQSVFTTFIAGIRGVTTGNNNAVNVVIDSDGQLGTLSSSRRFKKEIKPMDKASEAILALKPVTFHYKGDETNRPEFGLIAEDVAEINPDLVVRDDNGKVYTVRYDAVNAMLLNEFLKEHRKVEEQQATIARLKQDFQFEFAEQEKKIETLTKGLARVSAQLEADRSSPQVVAKSP